MIQEEILEYNKRCAEFLGYKPNRHNDGGTDDFYDNPQIYVSDLKFHSDWNWIMEVVEVIEELDVVASFQIENPTIYIWKSSEENTFKDIEVDINILSKKEAVVKAINQFLIWYNEHKTN